MSPFISDMANLPYICSYCRCAMSQPFTPHIPPMCLITAPILRSKHEVNDQPDKPYKSDKPNKPEKPDKPFENPVLPKLDENVPSEHITSYTYNQDEDEKVPSLLPKESNATSNTLGRSNVTSRRKISIIKQAQLKNGNYSEVRALNVVTRDTDGSPDEAPSIRERRQSVLPSNPSKRETPIKANEYQVMTAQLTHKEVNTEPLDILLPLQNMLSSKDQYVMLLHIMAENDLLRRELKWLKLESAGKKSSFQQTVSSCRHVGTGTRKRALFGIGGRPSEVQYYYSEDAEDRDREISSTWYEEPSLVNENLKTGMGFDEGAQKKRKTDEMSTASSSYESWYSDDSEESESSVGEGRAYEGEEWGEGKRYYEKKGAPRRFAGMRLRERKKNDKRPRKAAKRKLC